MPLYLKLITLIILPITLTSCAKAQGALAPTGDKYEGHGAYLPDPNRQASEGFLPDVASASLEPIINYVDGLNMALTGDFALITSAKLRTFPIKLLKKDVVAKAHNL